MRGAVAVALGAGALGVVFTLLILWGAPTWAWVAMLVFIVLAAVTLTVAVLARDPEARFRRFVLRTALLFGIGANGLRTYRFEDLDLLALGVASQAIQVSAARLTAHGLG